MKILFVMAYPGYLRYFDSTIAKLVDAGHEVALSFDRPGMQAEGMRGLEAIRDRVMVLPPPPRRNGWDSDVVRAIRGAADYARYLHPAFVNADYLRDRRRKALGYTPLFSSLGRVSQLGERWARLLLKAFLAFESATPSDPDVEAFLRGVEPDIVLVSPLVSEASPQTDVVKSARALGIPTAVCVASWDHLTTKGQMRIIPDRVFLWNETQRREAIEMHDVPPDRIVVTGAQPFDRWFNRKPSTTRTAFCKKVGIPTDRPYVLFVGSTASISGPEPERRFVRSWIEALRQSPDERIRDASILIRPHPYNPGAWAETDLPEFRDVAVWPRSRANPTDDADRAEYYDTLFHSEAVVGINTSAMIEAAIVGRPVFTIRLDEFSETQGGTLHFHYLVDPEVGFVVTAESLEEHVQQLQHTLLEGREDVDRRIAAFVNSFVRPGGETRSATDVLVASILAVTNPTAAAGVPMRLKPLRLLVAGAAAGLVVGDRDSVKKRRGTVAKLVERRGGRIAKSISRRGGAAAKLDKRLGIGVKGGARTVKRASRGLGTAIRGEARHVPSQNGREPVPDGLHAATPRED